MCICGWHLFWHLDNPAIRLIRYLTALFIPYSVVLHGYGTIVSFHPYAYDIQSSSSISVTWVYSVSTKPLLIIIFYSLTIHTCNAISTVLPCLVHPCPSSLKSKSLFSDLSSFLLYFLFLSVWINQVVRLITSYDYIEMALYNTCAFCTVNLYRYFVNHAFAGHSFLRNQNFKICEINLWLM